MVSRRPWNRLLANPYLYLLLLVVVLILFLRPSSGSDGQLWLTQKIQSVGSSKYSNTRLFSAEHPVKMLAQRGQTDFEHMVAHQSKSLTAAVAEYQRRYSRQPPRDFDKWFAFAKKHQSVIIDEFDMISEAMEPFWKLRPQEVRALIEYGSNGPRISNMSITGGHIHLPDASWHERGFWQILDGVASELPDLELLMNELDEPRVLALQNADLNKVRWKRLNKMPSWAAAHRPCHFHKVFKGDSRWSHIDLHGLPFVSDRKASMDLCQNPIFEHRHGFFESPYSFIHTDQPVPILSQAAASTYSDILYPSGWYWDHEDHELNSHDPDWETKRTRLYWAGSTTGGWTDLGTKDFALHHRQRFVSVANELGNKTSTFLTQSKPGVWASYESQQVLSQLYDVKFTDAIQCVDVVCEEEKAYFHMKAREDAHLGYQSRFLMDIDGNGFSGRFYNFLASKSTPLKQTIFREWHDERLFPWVHYVPVSVQMDELPEIMRYLALTTEGDEIAKSIAKMGREWSGKLLRKEDAAIYLYRLFLEFARVTSDEREDFVFRIST